MPNRFIQYIDGWDVVLTVTLVVKWVFAFLTEIELGFQLAITAITFLIILVGLLVKIEQYLQLRKGRKKKEDN